MAGVNNNLIPPVKGEIRNPKGKAKGTVHIKTMAKAIFEDMDTWNRLPVKDKNQIKQLREMVGKNKTYGQALLYAWLQMSLKDPRFATIVLELMDGKGKTELDVDGSFFTDNKLIIEVVDKRKDKTLIEEPEEVDYNKDDESSQRNPE